MMFNLTGPQRPEPDYWKARPPLLRNTPSSCFYSSSLDSRASIDGTREFYSLDSRREASLILATTVEPNLGQEGLTDAGCGTTTAYHQLTHLCYSKGDTRCRKTVADEQRCKKTGRGGHNVFLDAFTYFVRRFYWYLVLNSSSMAFLALLLLLDTKSGISPPRVSAALTHDKHYQTPFSKPTQKVFSISDYTEWGSSYSLGKSSHRTRKGYPLSKVGVLPQAASSDKERERLLLDQRKKHDRVGFIRPHGVRAPLVERRRTRLRRSKFVGGSRNYDPLRRDRHNTSISHHTYLSEKSGLKNGYGYGYVTSRQQGEEEVEEEEGEEIEIEVKEEEEEEEKEEEENKPKDIYVDNRQEFEPRRRQRSTEAKDIYVDNRGEFASRRRRRSAGTADDTQGEMDPLDRLSRVFGIKRLLSQDRPSPNETPPEYMTSLYLSITDSGGLTKANGPYNADIVQSFPDRDYRHQKHYFYNITFLEKNEQILQAEFHLFKLRTKKPERKRTTNPHLIYIEVHQVMSLKDVSNPQNLRLIDMKRISAYSHGWITFSVLKAVKSWLNNTSPNYGFLIKATSLSGEALNDTSIRFAQRKEHHDTKQPILVVFTDDGLQKHRNFISPNDEGYQEIKQDILRHEIREPQAEKAPRRPTLQKALRLLNEKDRSRFQQQKHGSYWGHGISRKRRSVWESPRDPPAAPTRERGRNSTSMFDRNRRTLFRRKRRNCARYEMYVDFNAIGWSGWIISPKGYNAYHCSGPCPFPLGQSHKPTNHATVQSIVHALRTGKNVMTPCCVPDKLYSISLLYFDDHENVILKLYEDMVAASCGCH